ncbi:hypothetical protein AALP_AA7G178300 [Arabis alpina]|uniref:Uncharacterized protein n=1 Tax=Arabis alpina TaxID=50452 RepID=A0A087GIS7_ARAAL|nr:hypothetical protein AALP_AA7G178300 [Arabis alpina]
MTDERRTAHPKDAGLRDLEDGEIQTDGSVCEDQIAHDDPPPAAPARVSPSGEKSKEAPRATSLLPELLQKMSAMIDALLESADRQNKTNGMITEELRSIGADVRTRALEPGLFRKPAPRLDPLALNFTTPVGSSSQPRQQHPSADAKDGRFVLLPQARREKAKIGDEPIEVDDDDEDLARQVMPDTELTEPERARQAAARGRNTYHRQAASQEFPVIDDDSLAGRDVDNAELLKVEAARQAAVRAKRVDRQKTTQKSTQKSTNSERARRILEDEENVEWVELTEAAEEKLTDRPEGRAAVRAQQDEMAEFRASLSKTTAELKTIRSQMHRATSKAPELDLILEQAQHTPFSARITKARSKFQ